MTTPASPRRRKERLVRPGDVPDDLLVVVRALPGDRERSLRNLIDDATDSADTYIVVGESGRRELLHGVSVFAVRGGQDVAFVLARFVESPLHFRTSAGRLRAAGFGLWATGTNPNHYDVQLVAGRVEGRDPVAGRSELAEAAARLLTVAGDPLINPGYAG